MNWLVCPLDRFFRDPTLYFFSVPRDVLTHCLSPLLGERDIWYLYGSFCQPRLIKTIDFPRGCRPTVYVPLKNEDFLFLTNENFCFLRINPQTEEVKWTSSSIRITTFSSNAQLDYLILTTKTNEVIRYILIQQLSQILTQAQFELALKNEISLEEAQKWHQLNRSDLKPEDPISLQVKALRERISEKPFRVHVGKFQGGHIIRSVQMVPDGLSQLQFYRCVD